MQARTSTKKKAVSLCIFSAFLLWQCSAGAEQLRLDVKLGQPVMQADSRATNYLKVSMTGLPMTKDRERAPVNVALVIDRSGSMASDSKLEKAKEAAVMAIDRLDSRDIVSVIAYDNTITVLLPATKVTDKDAIRKAIGQLRPGDTTALYAGVQKGAEEVRKFLDKSRVNRIVLLSDGQANVGPDRPDDLARLGAELVREGIVVTTIGLGRGYNEDLMSRLAAKSDGNHYFAEGSRDLQRFFDGEFGDILAVVARDAVLRITCAEGIRPVRVLGVPAEINGQEVVTKISQLYSEQEKYVILEVDVPAAAAEKTRPIAEARLDYVNLQTKNQERVAGSVSVRFSASKEAVERATDRDVMVSAIEQIATDINVKALNLRDQGNIKEARSVLLENARNLSEQADRYNAPRLREYAEINKRDADRLEGPEWDRTRKDMRLQQRARSYMQKTY